MHASARAAARVAFLPIHFLSELRIRVRSARGLERSAGERGA